MINSAQQKIRKHIYGIIVKKISILYQKLKLLIKENKPLGAFLKLTQNKFVEEVFNVFWAWLNVGDKENLFFSLPNL